MKTDSVGKLLIQWAENRPDLDLTSLGVAVRIDRLAAQLTIGANRALDPLGVSLWEYDVLSALRRQGRPYELSATALARETRMSGGAMTHRVTRLVKRGLVTRSACDEDRRAVLVRLTREGLEVVGKAIGERVTMVARALDALDTDERDMLDRLLGTVLASVEASERIVPG